MRICKLCICTGSVYSAADAGFSPFGSARLWSKGKTCTINRKTLRPSACPVVLEIKKRCTSNVADGTWNKPPWAEMDKEKSLLKFYASTELPPEYVESWTPLAGQANSSYNLFKGRPRWIVCNRDAWTWDKQSTVISRWVAGTCRLINIA